ncbi:MAG: ABC transporter ATP-binding protein, partial [Alphaproteobacteria bacterium]|nr:ABC transporter ATP-binding protein [Alphaproteobacteria bacterium]
IRRDIINSMFSYLNQHSMRYLQNNFAGSLSNKIMDMAGSTASIFFKLDEASGNLCAFVIAITSMWLINPIFSLILFIWVVAFYCVTLLFIKKTKLLSTKFSESKSVLTGKIVDVVANLNNVKLFASNSFENDNLSNAVNDTVKKDRDVQKYILKMRIWWDITFITLISSLFWGLIYLYSHEKISIGDFAFVMTVAINIFNNAWNLANQFVQFAEDLGKCAQALSIITVPHEITDVVKAKPLVVSRGKIVFDNVTFKYENNNNIFKNKSLEISEGSKVGLVGFSGSGKTTFANLILRLFDIQEGNILIDNQNIAEVTQESLHLSISMIPQDTTLFHRSIMENIRYGRRDATDNDVIEASKKAYCDEFIKALPEGYNSLVGERGVKLSGGQRQRIAIARAILKDAPILILDEATSALDSVTEHYIQLSLKNLMQGRTTIVIAHRLSTLAEMDRILVFYKGQIIEEGDHKTLMKANGHYAKLWNMQSGGFLPESEK